MKCSRCYDKLKFDAIVTTINGVKEIYCSVCFANEWGYYVENKVQVDGVIKIDNAKLKFKHYELNVNIKKFFVGN